MATRVLSSQEQVTLRSELQTAALAALMDSRRWEPGDIAFQGGTCLHLADGSARFSEDLDFMVRGGLSLEGLAKSVKSKIRLPPDIPADLQLTVSVGKDQRNPHVFYVTLSGARVVGSARVKIELWQTDHAALKSLQVKVSTVVSPAGRAFVPVLTLQEIVADKIYALGARARVKPRDVFDLWWLREKGLASPTERDLENRLAIYPAGSAAMQDTARAWLASASVRLAELQSSEAPERVAADLKRWLPSTWLMDATVAREMLLHAATQLSFGIALIHDLVKRRWPS